MNKIKDIIKNERIKKVERIDNLLVVETESNKYCIKEKNGKGVQNLFKYLSSKDFNNYLNIEINNNYQISRFINQNIVEDNEKLTILVYLISMLHTKTTYYENINLDEIKKIYEELTDHIFEVKKHYEDLVDKNDILLYPPPSMFWLMNNISIILKSLDMSKFYLDKWYEIIKDKQRIRKVTIHNNLKLSNLLTGDNYYLINWDKSIKASPIYDIESLFKNNYEIIDMVDIYNLYISKYQLFDEEVYLLMSRLLLINELELGDNEFQNTIAVNQKIYYLEKINEFLKNSMKN